MSKPVTVDEDDLRLLMEYAGMDVPVEDGEHEVNIVLARCAEALEATDGSEEAVGTAPESGLAPGDCEAPGAAQRVGEAVRAARQRANLSQTGLADALGVTQTAVSYWESGKRGMGIGDLVAVAAALGVPAVSLLPQDVPPDAAEPSMPPGRYARIEIPGFRQNTGWVTEETRFGVQCAVVRDWSGVVEAEVVIGPGSRVVYLPTPLKRPEPQAAIECGTGGFGYEVDGPDVAGPDWDWRERDGEPA